LIAVAPNRERERERERERQRVSVIASAIIFTHDSSCREDIPPEPSSKNPGTLRAFFLREIKKET